MKRCRQSDSTKKKPYLRGLISCTLSAVIPSNELGKGVRNLPEVPAFQIESSMSLVNVHLRPPDKNKLPGSDSFTGSMKLARRTDSVCILLVLQEKEAECGIASLKLEAETNIQESNNPVSRKSLRKFGLTWRRMRC
jgi:hypothetical protein